jgi:hypothetical protein
MTSKHTRRASAKGVVNGALQDSFGRLARRVCFLSKMQEHCFNCLSTSHSVASCCALTRCWRCLCQGHISSSCCSIRSSSPSATRSHTSMPVSPAQPPSPIQHMEPFDLSGRPEFDVCNLTFTQEIRDRIDFFESRSLIVWIGKNRPFTVVGHVSDAFISNFGLDQSSIQVSRHYPADFLVTIFDRDAFEEIADCKSFPYGWRQFRLRHWSPRDQATRAAMRFYVHLCMEGLPQHLWTESFAAAVIGRSCSLHFAEEHSRRRESIDVFELVAWTADPVAIPLRV